ncbi:hypothetical protein MKW98_024357, partial [Papaver atlanticum]
LPINKEFSMKQRNGRDAHGDGEPEMTLTVNSKPKQPTYMPIELCALVFLQRYAKALSVHQRSSLVKK